MIKRRHTFFGVGMAALLLVASACGIRGESDFKVDMDTDQQRDLWSQGQGPVFSAAYSLNTYLVRSDVAVARYALSSSGTRRLGGRVSTAELCAADTVVFFKLEAPGYPADWWYFSCYDGSFQRLEAEFPVVRLIGEKNKREAWLYHFRKTEADVESVGFHRFEGTAVEAALITADRSEVVLLTGGEPSRMSVYSLDGSRVAVMDLPTSSEPSGLFPLDDGGVVCALGEKGRRRLMKIDVAQGRIEDWDGTGANPEPCPFILAGAGEDDQPAVLLVPEVVDLPIVLALVEARNPAVNRRRALLIAALAEEGSLSVRSLPALQLGLDYTVAEGIFIDPIRAAGDVLAEGLVRGMIGLIKPIFDRSRRQAAAEVVSVRVSIAGDLLAEEIAHQTAEASREWARYQHLASRKTIDAHVVVLSESSQARHKHQMHEGIGRAVEGLRLKAEHQIAANAIIHDARALAAISDRLRRLCGLPISTPLQVAEVGQIQDFASADVVSGSVAEQRAVLNRSRFMAAQSLAAEAFYQQAANRVGVTGAVGARYGHVRQDDGAGVTDYINTYIQADVPLSRAAHRLHGTRAAALVKAQRAATADAAAEVRQRTRTAWLLASLARDRQGAAADEVAWRSEEARIAGIWSNSGGPGAGTRTDFAVLEAAQMNLFMAQQRLADRTVEAILAVIDLHEEMGSDSDEYVKWLPGSSSVDAPPLQVSTWLWQGKLVQTDPHHVLATLRAAGCSRLYLAIGGSGELLADAASQAATRDFIVQAQTAQIEVFALLGEPDWLTDDVSPDRAFERLAAFNRTAPGFTGLKLDVEPHALPDWQESDRRRELTSRWLAIIESAHGSLSGLPLWIDVHPDCVDIPGLSQHVTGATVMIYHADFAQTVARAKVAAKAWPKLFEIGIEMRPAASPQERASMSIVDIESSLSRTFSDSARFAGIAVHDFTGLPPAQEMANP